MKKYNIEFRFYKNKHDKHPGACVCCFTGLKDNVTEEQIKQAMGKAVTECFKNAKKGENATSTAMIMLLATQMAAQALNCCGLMLEMDSTATFISEEGGFTS